MGPPLYGPLLSFVVLCCLGSRVIYTREFVIRSGNVLCFGVDFGVNFGVDFGVNFVVNFGVRVQSDQVRSWGPIGLDSKKQESLNERV